jgi:hypothetical protein
MSASFVVPFGAGSGYLPLPDRRGDLAQVGRIMVDDILDLLQYGGGAHRLVHGRASPGVWWQAAQQGNRLVAFSCKPAQQLAKGEIGIGERAVWTKIEHDGIILGEHAVEALPEGLFGTRQMGDGHAGAPRLSIGLPAALLIGDPLSRLPDVLRCRRQGREEIATLLVC